MPDDPRPTRYTLGDPVDPLHQIHLWTDDGERWRVTTYYGQWLNEHGRWEWRPRGGGCQKARAWRQAREWDYDTALARARAALDWPEGT